VVLAKVTVGKHRLRHGGAFTGKGTPLPDPHRGFDCFSANHF
jgi:hypothetical protein